MSERFEQWGGFRALLKDCGGNLSRVADLVGLSRERVRQIALMEEVDVRSVKESCAATLDPLDAPVLEVFQSGVKTAMGISALVGASSYLVKRSMDRQGLKAQGRSLKAEALVDTTIGSWDILEVLPGTPVKLRCRCRGLDDAGCGYIGEIPYSNLAGGRSKSCHACGIKRRGNAKTARSAGHKK
jgi:hypothetical protein